MQLCYRLRKITIEQASREDFPASLAQHLHYIDPVVWPSLLGIYELLQLSDKKFRKKNVGVIFCRKGFPKSYRILNSLSRNRCASSFHFTAANAMACISMICSTFHFHGPTLNLGMSAHALATIDTIIQQWLYQSIQSIFIIKQEHQLYAQIEHIFIDNSMVKNAITGVLRR